MNILNPKIYFFFHIIFIFIDGSINKKKVEKGLEQNTTANGSSATSNGIKHHSSLHQDNHHRTSRSAGNSRNNSGGNNTKCDKKELIDMEHSSVSTDSSTHSSNSTASKLSKVYSMFYSAKTNQEFKN